MTLGDVFLEAAKRNLIAPEGDNELFYSELIKDGVLHIKFSCSKYEEATIECSIPYTGDPQEENYIRLYFLSMIYNAAIHGMKRMKHKKPKRK